MAVKILDLRAWIETRYSVDAATGCWNWLGSRYRNGYGHTKIPGSRGNCMAHRLAYRILHGDFDETLVLDHLCQNKACVNPSHLEPVTQGENLRRAGTTQKIVAIAKARGTRSRCSKGHPLTGENLYIYPRRQDRPIHRGCRACMRQYRITNSAKTKRKS